jgi:ATP:ADP antiporter, AAA family
MPTDPGAGGGAHRSGFQGFMQRLVVVEPQELRVLLTAFATLFFMFACYTMMRPIRETMGIDSGVEKLPALFWGTFVAMLLVQPVYGWLTSHFPRTAFLPYVYLFFTANILAFWVWFNVQSDHTWIARAYFVWVSVFTLFIVAVFWSLMADVFTREQAGRMFGFIAAGASTGGLVGPFLAGRLAKPIGTINLLLIAAVLLAIALFFMLKIVRWNREFGANTRRDEGEKALGGTSFAGFVQVVRSPYLLGIALFVFLLTWVSTFMYLEQQKLVALEFTTRDARTQFFANIDFWVQAASLLTQTLIFARLFKKVGLTLMIVSVPILMTFGYIAYALVPTFAVAVGAMIIRRVGEYSISRPCRDTLYTVVTREEKYKAKSLIDTFVYRGGDATSASVHQFLTSVVGFTGAGIGWFGAAIAALWGVLSLSLGKAQEHKRAPSGTAPVGAESRSA